MLDNPNLLQHLTEAGRHRLEETVKRAEEDQLRAALRGRDASVGGFGGAVVLAAAEVEQKQQGGPGVGRWRDKKARKSVRSLACGRVLTRDRKLMRCILLQAHGRESLPGVWSHGAEHA